jgi:hypothetical protein
MTIDQRQIDDAIGAHHQWKARLKNVIATGQLDVPLERIALAGRCALGQWLQEGAPDGAPSATHCRDVLDLHVDFHRVAAKVAALALEGRKSDAQAMLAPTGEFTLISNRLAHAMAAWRATIVAA